MIAKKDILSIENKEHVIVHSNKSKFELKDASILNNQLNGFSFAISEMPPANRVVDVFVYRESAIQKFENSNKISIPLDRIKVAKVHDLKVGATILTAVAGSAALVLIIVAITDNGGGSDNQGDGSGNGGNNNDGSGDDPNQLGGSCPFIFTNNGSLFEFAGEIYSGSTFPELERHDYLYLPKIKDVEGEYTLKMSNELREIQHTNMLELLVFDHPKGTNILLDKYGKSHTISNPQPPVIATIENGRSVIDEIAYIDDIHYLSDFQKDPSLFDPIYLSFDRPEKSNFAKLIIQGKNTIWLDYIYGRYINLYGRKYDKWNRKYRIKDEKYLKQWTLDQGIPLSVFLKSEDGWQFLDYYHTAGPWAEKQDVLNLDISSIKSNKVEVKLEAGFLFWELDYVAIDFTPDVPVNKIIKQIDQAIDHNLKDVSELLREDDNEYLVQPEIGDEVSISFQAPVVDHKMARSVFLHSKGYYEIVCNSTAKPDAAYMANFNKPGFFIQFSNEKFLECYWKATAK